MQNAGIDDCMGRRMECRADRVWHIASGGPPGGLPAATADSRQTPTLAARLMLRIPLKKYNEALRAADRSTGADSSLCNKSGSLSNSERLVCASGGRRTMANSMVHDAAYPLLSAPHCRSCGPLDGHGEERICCIVQHRVCHRSSPAGGTDQAFQS